MMDHQGSTAGSWQTSMIVKVSSSLPKTTEHRDGALYKNKSQTHTQDNNLNCFKSFSDEALITTVLFWPVASPLFYMETQSRIEIELLDYIRLDYRGELQTPVRRGKHSRVISQMLKKDVHFY